MPSKQYQMNEAGDWVELTAAEAQESRREAKAEHAKQVAAKGHDCWEHSVHEHYERAGGGLGDSYVCALCGEVLQVG